MEWLLQFMLSFFTFVSNHSIALMTILTATGFVIKFLLKYPAVYSLLKMAFLKLEPYVKPILLKIKEKVVSLLQKIKMKIESKK